DIRERRHHPGQCGDGSRHAPGGRGHSPGACGRASEGIARRTTARGDNTQEESREIERSMRSDEIGKELQFHIDERASELISPGSTMEEAVRQARLEFGGVFQVQETCREARQSPFQMGSLAHDFSSAVRYLRRNPRFTAVAVAILALGIGATTTLFNVTETL